MGRGLAPPWGVLLPAEEGAVLGAAGGGGGQGDRGRLLGAAGDGGLCLGFGALDSGLDLVGAGWVGFFFRTFSLERAFFSFSFSLSLSFFSFFFFSIGAEFRLRGLWVMSGVLADTLQRSGAIWWAWRWEQPVRGLAEAEREQWWGVELLVLTRVAALRLRARKERVGVISRSTMRLSHGLRRRLRVSLRDVWFKPPAQDHLCWRISAQVFLVDLFIACS